jgi:hypothetical protein
MSRLKRREDPVGTSPNNGGNGQLSKKGGPAPGPAGPPAPRRIVLLAEGEESEVRQVLVEYPPSEMTGDQLHRDVRRWAEKNSGRFVAVEWLAKQGWTRYLWCRL